MREPEVGSPVLALVHGGLPQLGPRSAGGDDLDVLFAVLVPELDRLLGEPLEREEGVGVQDCLFLWVSLGHPLREGFPYLG